MLGSRDNVAVRGAPVGSLVPAGGAVEHFLEELRRIAARHVLKLVPGATLLASVMFVYGFIFLMVYLSTTQSRLLPGWCPLRCTTSRFCT